MVDGAVAWGPDEVSLRGAVPMAVDSSESVATVIIKQVHGLQDSNFKLKSEKNLLLNKLEAAQSQLSKVEYIIISYSLCFL